MATLKEARPHNQVEIPRRIDLIDFGLRTTLRELVCGKLRWPLFLWGAVGTGKTAAGLCLCDHIADSWYTTTRKLVANVLAKDSEQDQKDATTKRLVVLDELGARNDNPDFVCEIIQELCDRRERKNRVAVYISNVDVQGIAKLYDARIASRVSCGTVFELKGQDRRRVTTPTTARRGT